MKPSVAESTEFRDWLKDQNMDYQYDYKITSYYRMKAAERNKKFFRKASVLLIIAIGILTIISFVL